MWALIKADFSYYKPILGISYLINFFFSMGAFSYEALEIYAIIGMGSTTFIVVMIIIGIEENKSKKDRADSLLPIPLKQISLARFVFVIIYQLGLFSFWVLYYLVYHVDYSGATLLDMLSLNAYLICIAFVFLVAHDLKYFPTKIYRYSFIITVIFIFVLSIISIRLWGVQPFFSFGPAMHKSLTTTGCYQVALILMCILSYGVFNRRHSYQE